MRAEAQPAERSGECRVLSRGLSGSAGDHWSIRGHVDPVPVAADADLHEVRTVAEEGPAHGGALVDGVGHEQATRDESVHGQRQAFVQEPFGLVHSFGGTEEEVFDDDVEAALLRAENVSSVTKDDLDTQRVEVHVLSGRVHHRLVVLDADEVGVAAELLGGPNNAASREAEHEDA